MVDVRGDVLRPPHGTTPAAVKSNIKSEMSILKVYLKIKVLHGPHLCRGFRKALQQLFKKKKKFYIAMSSLTIFPYLVKIS